MNNKVVTIVFIGLSLLLLLSVGGSFWDGSFDLLLHNGGNWKFPRTLFIFWVGMSQAGVLLSAFLLVMKVKIHRPHRFCSNSVRFAVWWLLLLLPRCILVP